MKSETYLQFIIISIVAAIFSLGLVRLYPLSKMASFTQAKSVNAQTIITPIEEIIREPLTKTKVPPTQISFSQLELTLPIATGEIKNNEWTLYEDKASWLSTSEIPGSGNVIIYAHNRKNLFGDLDRLKIGELIILTHEGKDYNYQVASINKVLPTDVTAILGAEDQLTLYTCDGAFDQKRLVVTAVPITP